MKTLRNKNRKPVKHKSNKNRRRHTHKNRKPKKRTSIRKRKGGLFGLTTTEMRATSGDQAPVLEVFQQLYKTYMKFKEGTVNGKERHSRFSSQTKHEFHKAKLTAAVLAVHPDIIANLKLIYVNVPGVKTDDGSGITVRVKSKVGGDIAPPAPTYDEWTYPKPVTEKPADFIPPSTEAAQSTEDPLDRETLFARHDGPPAKAEVEDTVSAAYNTFNIYTQYLIDDLDPKYTGEVFSDLSEDNKYQKEQRVKELIRFLFEKYIAPFPELVSKDISEKKGLAETLKLLKKIWSFTRHGPSCNNMVSTGSAITNLVTMGRWDEKYKTMEPSLADGGITRLIEFKLDQKNKGVFDSDHVFVSPLIRTWMTAIILYGINPKEQGKPLHLCVSPFLKEHYQFGHQSGNFPIPVPDQIENIQSFLTFLRTELEGKGITFVKSIVFEFPRNSIKEAVDDIYPTSNIMVRDTNNFTQIHINTDFINKKKKKTAGINEDRNSVELIPTEEEIKEAENGIGGGGYEQREAKRAAAKTAYNARLASPSKIVDNTHLNDFYGLNRFKVKRAASLHLLIKHVEKKADFKNEFYHPLNYAYDGKINEFVSWVTRFEEKLKHYTDNPTIHIVGHSNLMKGGLKEIDKETGKNYRLKAEQQGITETNAWRLLINKTIDNITMYKGIPKEFEDDPTWENSKMCNTKLVDKANEDQPKKKGWW